MKKINFENLPSTNIPVSANTLNQMQSNIEESAVIVSATEPTTSEKVWIQKSSNIFNEEFRQGGWNDATNTTRIYSTQNAILDAGEYVFNTNIDTSIYRVGVNVSTKVFPHTDSNAFIYDAGWQTVNEIKFTATQKGYLGIGISRVDGGNLTPDDIKNFYFKIEKGSTATIYEEYIDKKIYCKNDNGVYEELINIEEVLGRVKQYDYILDCGLVLHFFKSGRTVTCIAEGIITSLEANTDVNTQLADELRPIYLLRHNSVIQEGGLTGYIFIDESGSLSFRTRTAISSTSYPRFTFTYLAKV